MITGNLKPGVSLAAGRLLGGIPDGCATKPSESTTKRWKRRVKKVLIAASAIVCAAAITGVIYELISEHNDARRFPQEGRPIDVGGFQLNIHCTGMGAPAVILESGLGIPGMGWDLVQPGVQKFTQVCSYDRAGYGWSDPGPLPALETTNSERVARASSQCWRAATVHPCRSLPSWLQRACF
jgi:hypothetical protein